MAAESPLPPNILRPRLLYTIIVVLTANVCATGCRRTPLPSPEPRPDTASTSLAPVAPPAPAAPSETALPKVDTAGTLTLERALTGRRSVRAFDSQPLTLFEIGQIAWAAQGVTDSAQGLRTAPSAGALYPLEIYFVTAEGLSHYLPARQALQPRKTGDLRMKLSTQSAVQKAPCVVVITSVTERTRRKYGERAERYAAIEAGHVGQDILLEATALGLAGVPVGAFSDESVREVLGLDRTEDPLYLIAIGKPSTK